MQISFHAQNWVVSHSGRRRQFCLTVNHQIPPQATAQPNTTTLLTAAIFWDSTQTNGLTKVSNKQQQMKSAETSRKYRFLGLVIVCIRI